MTTHPYRPGIPAEILALSHERDLLRRRGQYDRADRLKQQIEDAGYVVKDNPHGAHLVILPTIDVDGRQYRMPRLLPSLLEEPDLCTFSVHIVAQNNSEQVRRCVESVLRYANTTQLEIIVVDNASQDGLDDWADTLRDRDGRLHVLRASRLMGSAEARNIGLKQSRGCYILLLDANIELTGDIFTPLAETLSDSSIGITGYRGLHTEDLRHFEESQQTEVEVIDGTCMAFRRALLKQGLFDEGYRFPLYMDIDFNFAIRAEGVQSVVTAQLPLISHPGVQSHPGISDAERTRLTKRNFYRFLSKWGERDDLLLDEKVDD